MPHRKCNRGADALNLARPLIRWTIGDVSTYGFEALRLSTWGATRIFGDAADYVITVNSITSAEAQLRTGDVPQTVGWIECSASSVPKFIKQRLDDSMSEGTAWKFAMPRLAPDRFEIALDNDVVLWEVPGPMESWLADAAQSRCLVAEDVVAMFGKFAPQCGSRAINGGIRGFPPGFDYEAALREVLMQNAALIQTEIDEQGLQAAAMMLPGVPDFVTLQDVTICSPWPPHLPYLGRCGAHFVGLNGSALSWEEDGRNAIEQTREKWRTMRAQIEAKIRSR